MSVSVATDVRVLPQRRRGRVLWVERNGDLVIGTDDGGLLRLAPWSGRTELVAASPYTSARQMVVRSRLVARLTRSAPRCYMPLADGGCLWVAGGRMWRLAAGERHARRVFDFAVGHGPLFIARDSDGSLLWADYIAKRTHHSTMVRRSTDDGRTWDEVFRFAPKDIRHVHGAFWDHVTRKIWLTTGDSGHEIGLWTLEGNRPRLVAGGEDRFRIVQPLFTEHYVVFGSDVPDSQNNLYALDRASGEIRTLFPVRAPVFFACRAGGWLAFSTVVEPAHPERHAAVYLGSADTLQFAEVLLLAKDRWDGKLFQYGQVYCPQNDNDRPLLWWTPMATEHDGSTICVAPEGLPSEAYVRAADGAAKTETRPL